MSEKKQEEKQKEEAKVAKFRVEHAFVSKDGGHKPQGTIIEEIIDSKLIAELKDTKTIEEKGQEPTQKFTSPLRLYCEPADAITAEFLKKLKG